MDLILYQMIYHRFLMKKLRDNEKQGESKEYIFSRDNVDQLIKKLIDKKND